VFFYITAEQLETFINLFYHMNEWRWRC